MNIKIEELQDGLKLISGGTRREVSLDRPWQTPLADLIDPANCPFEEAFWNVDAIKFPDLGWFAIDNTSSVHEYRKLIMPEHCWSAEKLQRLGGAKEIEMAFRAAMSLSSETGEQEHFFCVQIGLHGGQSKGHPHYQLQSPERCKDWCETLRFFLRIDNSNLVIARNDYCKAVLGGKYAGQCFILTEEPLPAYNRKAIKAFSRLISTVVDLYNTRFVSTQGLPPDFAIGFLLRNSRIVYGSYVPTLYHQWGARDKLADVFGLSVVVSWPHEVTFKRLMGRTPDSL